MAFRKKTWKDQKAQYQNRYNITPVSDGTSIIEKNYGAISVIGDKLNAETMNDLESRIEQADIDNDGKIATVNEALNEVQTDVADINRGQTLQDKRIRNLEEASKGNLYYLDEQTEDKYLRDVPSNALPNQPLTMIGGKTVKCKNLLNDANINFVPFIRGVSITKSIEDDGTVTFLLNGVCTETTWINLSDNSSYYKTGLADGVTRTFSIGEPIGVYLRGEDPSQLNFSNSGTVTSTYGYYVAILLGKGIDYSGKKLKLMLNEGITPLPYEPYYDGLRHASVDDVISYGANLWDEEWELGGLSNTDGSPSVSSNAIRSKNFTEIRSNTSYYVADKSTNGVYLYQYDINYGFIKVSFRNQSNGWGFTSDPNARYFKLSKVNISTYNNDIAIVKGTSGTYKPYFEKHKPLPSSVQTLPCYGMGVETSYNQLNFVKQKFTGMSSVDLGTLSWGYVQQTSNVGFFTTTINDLPQTNNLICFRYSVFDYNMGGWNALPNMMMRTGATILRIRDDSFNKNAEAFKQAMKGEVLHYESTSGGEGYDAKVYTQRENKILARDLNWEYVPSYDGYFTASIYDSKPISSSNIVANIMASKKYATVSQSIWHESKPCISRLVNGSLVLIGDDDYNNVEDLVNSFGDMEIVYELATPRQYDVTEILKDFDNYIETEPNGTIEMHNTNDMAIDVPSTIAYGLKVEV